jgi:hypothetical protein
MTTPARPTPKANVAAMVSEIIEEARKNAQEADPAPSRRISSVVAAFIVMALCAWVWIAPPSWLVPPPVAPASREYREASTRVALALHAQRIEAYRSSHGRLPRTKQEVGIVSDQVTYDRADSLSYELTSRVDGQPVSYKSSQPRDRYLAEAMTALTRARR